MRVRDCAESRGSSWRSSFRRLQCAIHRSMERWPSLIRRPDLSVTLMMEAPSSRLSELVTNSDMPDKTLRPQFASSRTSIWAHRSSRLRLASNGSPTMVPASAASCMQTSLLANCYSRCRLRGDSISMKLSGSEIATQTGLPPTLVRQQLLDAILLPRPPERIEGPKDEPSLDPSQELLRITPVLLTIFRPAPAPERPVHSSSVSVG